MDSPIIVIFIVIFIFSFFFGLVWFGKKCEPREVTGVGW
jgi:hypothetical protein